MYAKLENGNLVPAPRSYGATCNPSAATHLAHGYKPVVDEPPETDAEHYAAPTGWLDLPDRIEREYEVRENPPPPPRVFSKLKVVAALMSAGVWPQVKQYIENAGLYDLYLAAQEFAEDNEYFVRGKEVLMSQLGWDGERVEAVLAASVKD